MLTNLDFLTEGQNWPPSSEAARLSLYEENRNLREGDVNKVWPDLNRVLRDDRPQVLDFYLGYPWLVTKKTIDLTIGEPPQILLPKTKTGTISKENANQGALNDLLISLRYKDIMSEQLQDLDALGDSVQKISRSADNKVKISSVGPEHWYPVLEDGTNEIEYHVLAFKRTREDSNYLEVEIHSKTTIEHRIYQLNQHVVLGTTGVISKRLDWQEWNPDVKEVEANESGDFLVVVGHNMKPANSCYGRSSYGRDFKDVLKKLIIRFATSNNTLDVFGKPTIFGDRNLTEYDPVTRKPMFHPGQYIGMVVDPGTTPVYPQALTWDAHLAEARQEREDLRQELFNVSEMSPVLFSANALVGEAESGTALRLRLTNTLAKCSRIRESLDVAARKALQIAGQLSGLDMAGVYIEWADGLPIADQEQATYYSLMLPILGRREILRLMEYDQDEISQIMADAQDEII